MILSRDTIQKEIDKKTLVIIPEPVIKEASIKIHLSGEFGVTRGNYDSLESYTLKPKGFILAKSREKITMPLDIAGLYDGYIGVSAQGLLTHCCSMFLDPGFDGHVTLEIFNASDKEFILEKGMRVGHVVFMRVE